MIQCLKKITVLFLGDEDVNYDEKSRYVVGPTPIILKKPSLKIKPQLWSVPLK